MALETIYVVHHSHTDYGFTHDRPTVLRLHRAFLDRALELIEAEKNFPPGERFCWSVETQGFLALYGDGLPDLSAAIERGQLEFLALRNHQTPLADLGELAVSGHGARGARHALSCDVNGQNWDLVDVLLDAGVKSYTTAINTHFGRAPGRRPEIFRWQGPSGRMLPVFNGFPYGAANRFGIGGPDTYDFEHRWLPRLQQHLDERGYRWPGLLLTAIHTFGDNGAPNESIAPWIRAWNASGKSPRIHLGTMDDFWGECLLWAEESPIIAGDWTDFWIFGALSRARELAIVRENRVRIRSASLLAAALSHEEAPAAREANLDYIEHTWNADWARSTHLDDPWTQGIHKSSYAATARTESTYWQRELLGELASEIPDTDGILVVNPLPYPATFRGMVPAGVEHSRGGFSGDPTAQRHYQDRNIDFDRVFSDAGYGDTWGQSPHSLMQPVTLPPFGYQVFSRKNLLVDPRVDRKECGFVENPVENVHLDSEIGLCRWRDLVTKPFGRLRQEVPVDPAMTQDALFQMDWGASEIEIPSGWIQPPPYRLLENGPIESWRVIQIPLGTWVEFIQDGCRTILEFPADADWIGLTLEWVEPWDPSPRARYVDLPFDIPGAVARIDGGGCVYRPGFDQIPGCCHDHFTAQTFVDISNGERGVVVACSFNPLFMFGGPMFGRAASRFEQDASHLVGMVTNNYWQCNCDPVQPGSVRAQYRFLPYNGAFSEERSRQFGAEHSVRFPVLQRLDEPKKTGMDRSPEGVFFELEPGPVRPAEIQNGRLLMHNYSDQEVAAYGVNFGPRRSNWISFNSELKN